MEKIFAVILAKERENALKSEMPTALHCISSKPLYSWVESALKGVADEIATVVSEEIEEVFEELSSSERLFGAEWDIPEEYARGAMVVAVNADMPLITEKTVRESIERHKKEQNGVTVVSDECGAELAAMYIFSGKVLEKARGSKDGGLKISEILEAAEKTGDRVGKIVAKNSEEMLRIADCAALSEAEKIVHDRVISHHMKNGVTFILPETTVVEVGVKIGTDTVVYPGAVIKRGTKIGRHCTVGMNTMIENSEIGDGVNILSSVILCSSVGSGTSVGPFAYIRPGSSVGESVKVGDFVEIKNSTVGDGTKISHLTYVGDSDVGERVNFGCGTVTVNYDGRKKYRTTIGDDSFIGCNTNLVAPVTVERGGYIAAGSTITDTVPSDGLAIARARQVVKKEWKDRRK